LPFNPPADQPYHALCEIAGIVDDAPFDLCDQYGIQADLFSRAILENTDVPAPIGDSLANMRVIEAFVHSAKSADDS
jgi:hypothetical protein